MLAAYEIQLQNQLLVQSDAQTHYHYCSKVLLLVFSVSFGILLHSIIILANQLKNLLALQTFSSTIDYILISLNFLDSDLDHTCTRSYYHHIPIHAATRGLW
jgi:hypothetical protein